MNCRNQVLPRIFLLSASVTGAFSGCSNERPTPRAQAQTVSDVSVFVVQRAIVPDALEAIGSVRAAQSSQVASQMMGNIVQIHAQEGDRMQSGQVLAILDDAQPRSAVEQATAAEISAEKDVSAAESEFTLAEATLKRYQQLYEKKSVSPQEFDESKARHQSAEARRDMARAQQTQAKAALAQARTSLGYTRIRAPFAGVMTEKKADAGTRASPGMPLFTIEDTRSYRLEVAVDESDIRLVHVGQAAPVTIDALGSSPLPGKVAQIVPAADAASRSFLVKVQLPRESHLRSGLFGRAQFSRGERSALLIPRTAVVERGQLQGVYVLDANQIAGLRYVTLGKSVGEKVEILSGLQDGEKLVAAPTDQELSGKKILVQR